ncbi:IS701 family transposase [Actinoplanes sp. NPDC026623]|uniref:IS701 family transposase n=1 Tax=Actinoplanes sp. NPDC026623 TaxID=3155610 RepID=UPI0034008D45
MSLAPVRPALNAGSGIRKLRSARPRGASVEDDHERTNLGAEDHFLEFCGDIFQTLHRVDQRRAGQTYLNGLLNCEGRKSIRRMAALSASHHSEQSLQQFINQSPWDHRPIRERLLGRLVDAVKPEAWVISELAFPKHGRYSAAVHRQYVRAERRVSNCQLATVAVLATEEHSVPVNWRLVLPEPWRADEERRSRARMPAHELPRPYWQYQIETIDDMILDWGMAPAPVVVDAVQLATVDALLAGLTDRKLPYLVQVGPNVAVRYAPDRPRLAGGRPVMQPGVRPQPWRGTAGDLVHRLHDQPRSTVSWENQERVHRSQFLTAPIMPPGGETPAERSDPTETEHQLVVDWPFNKSRPRGFWITNLTDESLSYVVRLTRLPVKVHSRLESLASRFGLRDYEGRTFGGWHHHVTMVSAAYIYALLDSLRATNLA